MEQDTLGVEPHAIYLLAIFQQGTRLSYSCPEEERISSAVY